MNYSNKLKNKKTLWKNIVCGCNPTVTVNSLVITCSAFILGTSSFFGVLWQLFLSLDRIKKDLNKSKVWDNRFSFIYIYKRNIIITYKEPKTGSLKSGWIKFNIGIREGSSVNFSRQEVRRSESHRRACEIEMGNTDFQRGADWDIGQEALFTLSELWSLWI